MPTLKVNNQTHLVASPPETPLLYVLRNELGLKGPKLGCGLEQCNSCKVLIDGQDVPSCQLPLSHVEKAEITTIEGLGTAVSLHPLQEAFMEEQAIQCGYCVSGMIMAAQGLLNRTRHPTDQEIQEALAGNLCRCGVHERVRRAIKLRIGQPSWEPIYEVQTPPPLPLSENEKDDLRSIKATPHLDSWIQIDTSDTITVFSGKVEIGQGIVTAVTQLAAEELDVSPSRIRVVTADTQRTPDEGATAGSMSVEMTGAAIRVSAAEARHFLLKLAHEALEAQSTIDQLTVKDGTITDPATGRQTDYWQIYGGKLFGIKIQGHAPLKATSQHNIVGHPEKRTDLLSKVTGQPAFIHDIDLPNMVHGRIVRPPRYLATLQAVDKEPIAKMPGVLHVVQDGSFLGVIAETEYTAVLAMEALRETAVWHNDNPLPAVQSLPEYMQQQQCHSHPVINGIPQMDSSPPPITTSPLAAQTVQASYSRPFQMHGSLSPSAAVAHWQEDGSLTIWSHSQAIFRLRATLSAALTLNEDQIRVIHAEAAGCYGHNGADDVALDAALLARAAKGRPISVKWMREDEHTWEPYGSAMVMALQADLDTEGQVVSWNQDVWSYTHMTRPNGSDASGLLAMWHLDEPTPPTPPAPTQWPEAAEYRNLQPKYAFNSQRTVRHFIPDNPVRASALRTLGAYANIFAIESFMDELAHTAGIDPVQFRLAHLADERAKAVIEAVAEKAGWQQRPFPQNNGIGRGIGFGQYKNRQCYTAVVVEVELQEAIVVKRVIIAADAGEIVNPDGLSNQLEGGAIQALSWTLFEAVTWDAQGITSRDWEGYPILRFPDAPRVETVLLNRPERPFLGVGEAAQGPTAAALANAIFDATSQRLRHMPLNRSFQKRNQP